MAVLSAMQVETAIPVSTVPGTQVLEEPTVEVAGDEEEPPELLPQESDGLHDNLRMMKSTMMKRMMYHK